MYICAFKMEELIEEEKARLVKCRIQTFCFILFLVLIGYGVYEYLETRSYT